MSHESVIINESNEIGQNDGLFPPSDLLIEPAK